MIIRAIDASNYFPNLHFREIPIEGTEQETEEVFYGELGFTRTDHAVATSNYQLIVSPVAENRTAIVENLTPAVCSYDGETGLIVGLQQGSGILRITCGPLFRTQRLVFSTRTVTSRQWTGFSGSTASSIMGESVLDLLDNDKDTEYYSGNPVSTMPNVTRNADCWLAGVDLAGSAICTDILASWSSANAGALITPRHYAGVLHWLGGNSGNMGPGKKIRFAGNDGTMVERTVLSRVSQDDLIICTLDSDVPATVPHFSIPGEWMLSDPIDGKIRHKGIGFLVNQDKQIGLVAFDVIDGFPWHAPQTWTRNTVIVTGTVKNVFWQYDFTGMDSATHPVHGFDKFIVTPRTGDSGGMLGVLVGSTPLLVSLFSSLVSGVCFNERNAPILNRMISDADTAAGVATGYTVTIAPDPTPS